MNIGNLYVNSIYTKFFITFVKIFFICLFSLFTSIKLSFSSRLNNKQKTIFLFSNFIVSLCTAYISTISNKFSSTPVIILFSITSLTLINEFKLIHSFIIGSISLCINYFVFLLSLLIIYTLSIFTKNLTIIFSFTILLYSCIIIYILKLKRFKYGLSFIKSSFSNHYLDLIILNISIVILMFFILLPQINHYFTISVTLALIIFSIIMAITIYKSFSLYYKHNLLVKELNDTKLELEKKDKEIKRLEKENLEFSKTSHSIAHKQRALEYKLNQLQLNTEFADELDISDKLKEISNTYSSNVTNLTLPKTDITNIDNVLEYMQSECIKSDINFELQLNGDIFSMVTTVINKEKLEILLSDHIKNAIIAINSSENINKSILVRLGLINDIYSIYFYDSGIEFDEKVLSSLGKEQITTHKDIGGTGCGFLNTFDTLKEFNASLEINEISAPCKDNYTKSIVIKFDGKNDFTINSYKKTSLLS